MAKIVGTENNDCQYIQFKKLLNVFSGMIQSGSKKTNIDKIIVEVFPEEFELQFQNEEFVTIYHFLDAIADAKEHDFKFLFNMPGINFPFENAVNDLHLLMNALDICLRDNELLTNTDIYSKIKSKIL